MINTTLPPTARYLEGKIAIVTGASRGIGAAICEILASKGCWLAMNYSSHSSAEITNQLSVDLEAKYHVRVVPVQADIGSESGPAHLVSSTKAAFQKLKQPRSTFQIDIVVNNAGTADILSVGDCDSYSFATMYNLNVRGPMLLVRAALPYLPHNRSGRIVNVSSMASMAGLEGQTIYGGTKAALEAMTRTWSRELAERATVNAINPGPVATEMYNSIPREFKATFIPWNKNTPLAAIREHVDAPEFIEGAPFIGGRPAYLHEIAGVVAMICSPEAGWTTGSVICANGGMRFSY